MLIDYSGVANVKRDVTVANAASVLNSPSINALGGWILLRVGDNVTLGASLPLATSDADRLAKNTRVVAGKWIDVYGDCHGTASGPDVGLGSVMHLHGTVTPGPLTSAAPPSTRGVTAMSPGSSATSTPTRSPSTRPFSAAGPGCTAPTR